MNLTFKSSNLKKGFYNQNTRTLEVTFHSGHTYSYHNVTPAQLSALLNASSQGAFLRANFYERPKMGKPAS